MKLDSVFSVPLKGWLTSTDGLHCEGECCVQSSGQAPCFDLCQEWWINKAPILWATHFTGSKALAWLDTWSSWCRSARVWLGWWPNSIQMICCVSSYSLCFKWGVIFTAANSITLLKFFVSSVKIQLFVHFFLFFGPKGNKYLLCMQGLSVLQNKHRISQ